MAVENRGPQVEAVAILFLTLSWVFVSLRCYVRAVLMKSLGSDDWLAVVALILFSLYCTFVLKGVQYGTGQHLSALPEGNIPIALKWWWCCEVAYISSTCVLKISIGVFLIRICVRTSQQITIWIVMAIQTVFSIIYFFVIVFQCTPVIYFWTMYSGGSGTCLASTIIADFTYAHSAISVFTDWTLGVLPVFLVWNLKMNARTKISVAIILALGAIGSTATIVRIPYIKQLTNTTDFLYGTTDVAIWSTVEPGIGLTAAAMATLRPLFRTFFARSKLFGGTSDNMYKYGTSTYGLTGRKGYFRSGSGPDGQSRTATEPATASLELGLRNDIKKGDGVTTVINSARDEAGDIREKVRAEHAAEKSRKHESIWNNDESRLKDDSSSEEDVPAPAWAVRKTTEVTTFSHDTTYSQAQPMNHTGLEAPKKAKTPWI